MPETDTSTRQRLANLAATHPEIFGAEGEFDNDEIAMVRWLAVKEIRHIYRDDDGWHIVVFQPGGKPDIECSNESFPDALISAVEGVLEKEKPGGFAELGPINITDGEPSEDYIRRGRDDDEPALDADKETQDD